MVNAENPDEESQKAFIQHEQKTSFWEVAPSLDYSTNKHALGTEDKDISKAMYGKTIRIICEGNKSRFVVDNH